MRIRDEDALAEPEFSMAPLIDIVFQLLIFFMVATTYTKKEKELQIELPSAQTAQDSKDAPEEIVINVFRDGRVSLSGHDVERGDLVGALVEAAHQSVQVPVTIRGDRLVHHEDVVAHAMRHLGKNAVIVLALVAAGFLAAWLRFRSYLGDEGKFSDGTRTYDVSEAGGVRYAVWETPELLDGAVNTNASESRPALSPDGRWMVFTVGQRGMNTELYVAEMRDGKPTDPKPLAALDTTADECAPAFASDALYFASDRAGGAGGLDLYRAAYSDGDFGAAERLEGGVNSSGDDCSISSSRSRTSAARASR